MEYLFRGKRIDNGEWVEGYYLKNGKEYNSSRKTLIAIEGSIMDYAGLKFIEVLAESVGQFTGLHDSTKWENATEEQRQYAYEAARINKTTPESEWHGVKIFEGDIVRYPNPFDGGYYIGVITYQGHGFTINFITKHCSPMWDKYEICGNIHDNKELLEVK